MTLDELIEKLEEIRRSSDHGKRDINIQHRGPDAEGRVSLELWIELENGTTGIWKLGYV